MAKDDGIKGLYVDGEEVDFDTLTIGEMEFIEQSTGQAINHIDFNSISARKPLVIVLRRREGQVAATAFDDMSFGEFNAIFKPPTARPTRAAKTKAATKPVPADGDDPSE